MGRLQLVSNCKLIPELENCVDIAKKQTDMDHRDDKGAQTREQALRELDRISFLKEMIFDFSS